MLAARDSTASSNQTLIVVVLQQVADSKRLQEAAEREANAAQASMHALQLEVNANRESLRHDVNEHRCATSQI